MKILIAALAAVTAVTATAAPAAAQSYGRDHGRYEQNGGRYEQHDGRYDRREGRHDQNRGAYNLNQRQEELNRRIAFGLRNGSLTRGEASQLREDARDIARIEARYRANGLSPVERANLDRYFDRLENRIARQTHDRDYGQGYGYRR